MRGLSMSWSVSSIQCDRCVLFCALKPVALTFEHSTYRGALPGNRPVVDPSPATLPSATKPLVWLIWCVRT